MCLLVRREGSAISVDSQAVSRDCVCVCYYQLLSRPLPRYLDQWPSGKRTGERFEGRSHYVQMTLHSPMQFKVSGDLDALDDGKAFCHDGVQLLSLKGLANLWTDLRVLVSMSPKDGLIIGKGNSSEHALSGDETLTSQRNGSHLLHLSPYGVDCVGLVPEGGSQVRYQLAVKREVAHRHLVLLAMGLGLLFAAPRLSRLESVVFSLFPSLPPSLPPSTSLSLKVR